MGLKKGSILIIDDNKNVLTALRILLTNYFETVVLLSSPNQIHQTMREEKPDVVLLDRIRDYAAYFVQQVEKIWYLVISYRHRSSIVSGC